MEMPLIGNINFRLGWAHIRGKIKIDKGIEHLRKADDLIPLNIEIKIKLAGVLYKEKD